MINAKNLLELNKRLSDVEPGTLMLLQHRDGNPDRDNPWEGGLGLYVCHEYDGELSLCINNHAKFDEFEKSLGLQFYELKADDVMGIVVPRWQMIDSFGYKVSAGIRVSKFDVTRFSTDIDEICDLYKNRFNSAQYIKQIKDVSAPRIRKAYCLHRQAIAARDSRV